MNYKKYTYKGKEHPIIVVNYKMTEIVKRDNFTFKRNSNNNDTYNFSLTGWPVHPISPLDLSLLLMV
jgi:hypothetical protein